MFLILCTRPTTNYFERTFVIKIKLYINRRFISRFSTFQKILFFLLKSRMYINMHFMKIIEIFQKNNDMGIHAFLGNSRSRIFDLEYLWYTWYISNIFNISDVSQASHILYSQFNIIGQKNRMKKIKKSDGIKCLQSQK